MPEVGIGGHRSVFGGQMVVIGWNLVDIGSVTRRCLFCFFSNLRGFQELLGAICRQSIGDKARTASFPPWRLGAGVYLYSQGQRPTLVSARGQRTYIEHFKGSVKPGSGFAQGQGPGLTHGRHFPATAIIGTWMSALGRKPAAPADGCRCPLLANSGHADGGSTLEDRCFGYERRSLGLTWTWRPPGSYRMPSRRS